MQIRLSRIVLAPFRFLAPAPAGDGAPPVGPPASTKGGDTVSLRTAHEWYETGIGHLQKQDFTAAVGAFQMALKRNAVQPVPDFARATVENALGVSYLMRNTAGGNDQSLAEAAFREAIRHEPSNSLYHINLGSLCSMTGREDDAREAYKCAETEQVKGVEEGHDFIHQHAFLRHNQGVQLSKLGMAQNQEELFQQADTAFHDVEGFGSPLMQELIHRSEFCFVVEDTSREPDLEEFSHFLRFYQDAGIG